MNTAFPYIWQCTRWPFLVSSRTIGIVLYISYHPTLFPSPGVVVNLLADCFVVAVVGCFGPPPLPSWVEPGAEHDLRQQSFGYYYWGDALVGTSLLSRDPQILARPTL